MRNFMTAVGLCLVLALPAMAQQSVQEAQALAQRIAAQTAHKPLMAEEVFKNVQVLKGIPVNQFMETMGFFAASLAMKEKRRCLIPLLALLNPGRLPQSSYCFKQC